MNLRTLRRCSLGLSALVALLSAGSAEAATSVSTTCTSPVLYQPFLQYNDSNWYSLAPGGTYDSFTGSGWTLSGGAKISATVLGDGYTGSVLTLPPGSKAVSPSLCLNNTYPYMRTMFQQAGGGSANFAISYMLTSGAWGASKNIGSVTSPNTSWMLTGQVNLASGPYSGWNYAQVTITGGGKLSTSTSSIYNLYLDPRMKH